MQSYMSAWSNFCPHKAYTMKSHFSFWSRSQIIHMMKCRQDACGKKNTNFSQLFQWKKMVGRCKQNLTEMKPFSISGRDIRHTVQPRGARVGSGPHSVRPTAGPSHPKHPQDVWHQVLRCASAYLVFKRENSSCLLKVKRRIFMRWS